MTLLLAFAAVLLGVVLLLRRRSRRKSMLAGLDGTRPVFSVDPPARRIAPRKGERL